MVTIVVLNVVFAIVGLLIAVGIPVAGLFWQAQEATTPAVGRPVGLGGMSAQRGTSREHDGPAATHSADRSRRDRAA